MDSSEAEGYFKGGKARTLSSAFTLILQGSAQSCILQHGFGGSCSLGSKRCRFRVQTGYRPQIGMQDCEAWSQVIRQSSAFLRKGGYSLVALAPNQCENPTASRLDAEPNSQQSAVRHRT